MLIDSTYFNNEISINNLNSETELGESLRFKLDNYIKRFEPKYLTLLFGTDFYQLFDTGITNSEQRMIDLKAELLDEVLYLSPIANYVFFQMAKVDKDMVMGIIESNGERLNGVDQLTTIWNDMSEKSFEVYQYLKDNQSTYPEFTEPFKLNYINFFGI